MANEPLREKIIGSFYVTDNNRFFAADIYEGNYYKLVRGNSVETLSLTKEAYDRVVANYEKCVEEGVMLTTAYSMNQKANLTYVVPTQTADPEAAEKEWYLRTHPQVVPIAEPVVEEKRGLFGRKKKKKQVALGIQCPECGTVNKDGQKFCGECGCKLPTSEEKAEVPGSTAKEMDEPSVGTEAAPTSNAENQKKEGTEKSEKEPRKEERKEPRKESKTKEQPSYEAKEEFQEIFDEDEIVDFKEEGSQDAQVKAPEPSHEDSRGANISSNAATDSGRALKKSETEKTEKKSRGERKTKKREEDEKAYDEHSPKDKEKKGKVGKVLLLILFVLLVGMGASIAGYIFTNQGSSLVYSSEIGPSGSSSLQQSSSGHVVIKLTSDVLANGVITEEDLEGIILNDDQYEKYNQVSTYIDSNGETKAETLLLWENKDAVIGQYATRDLTKGSLLYDTSITKEHVIADKTYVDVDVDGETKTYETNTDVMPGSTKIQIVAIVQTDGTEPQQILLSEMTLQDRSLESIFDSAGQDVLEKLSGGSTEDSEENSEGSEENSEDAAKEGESADAQ